MAARLTDAPGGVLSPIAQRLLLYRFVQVDLQPGAEVPPLAWGLPFLQQLPVPGAWNAPLRRCLPFSELGNGPVVSTSLGALQALRRRRPDRPLILLRPPFLCPLGPGILRALVRRAHPTAGMTAPFDCLAPLLWLAAPPHLRGDAVEAYRRRALHPLEALWHHRRAERPHASFTIREDGLLQEQASLFACPAPPRPAPDLQQDLACFERLLRVQLACLRGAYYVFAADQARLDWFRRDVRRLLPARFHCVDYPCMPHPASRAVTFVLVSDRRIRLATLPPLPALHLDGCTRVFYYRAARMVQGRARWVAAAPARATARYPTLRGVLRFVPGDDGWCCHPGGPEASLRIDRRFYRRAQVHEALFGDGSGTLCRGSLPAPAP